MSCFLIILCMKMESAMVQLEIHSEESIDVAFPTKNGICYVTVNKTTDRFNYNRQPASRHQFPIQNAFALTVHKTQGLTLPDVTVLRFTNVCSWSSKCCS